MTPVTIDGYTFQHVRYVEKPKEKLANLQALTEPINGCKVYIQGNYFVYDIERNILAEIQCDASVTTREGVDAIISFLLFLKPRPKAE